MGSLKNEMPGGLVEEQKLMEKSNEGGPPVASDHNSPAEGQSDTQPRVFINSDQDCGKNSKEESDSNRANDSTCPLSEPEPDDAPAEQRSEAIPVSISTDPYPGQRDFVSDVGKDVSPDSIAVSVPLTPGPADPRSPAPFGQHHMRTQVSLEVTQCVSVATSPMTPPQGDGGSSSFFFPNSFGKPNVGGDTRDTVLQAAAPLVEFCSVATSPMTPKTPSFTAFPALVGKESTMKRSEEQMENGRHTSKAESGMTTDSDKFSVTVSRSEDPSSSVCRQAAGTVAGSVAPSKQQRMGSMDQDITILVTHHGNNGEEGEDGERDESYVTTVEAEIIKANEFEAKDNKGEEEEDKVLPDSPSKVQDPKDTAKQSEEAGSCVQADESETIEEVANAPTVKSAVPESPAPFGCHNIRTQVSLEVVQCQSVATSPMTPPEGGQAFYFPSTFSKCGGACAETKDAELQVGREVEFRSVATAPMTPRTPTVTTFPEVKTEVEKIHEEEEAKPDEKQEEEKAARKEDEVGNCKSGEEEEENCEEPVQEVSWDEKGMTWEVYGAVVEVAVLGSAIQKHLEKQVKKQKRQSSMPPPPPLNPAATPLTPEAAQGGSGKGCAGKRGEQGRKGGRRRRNPFRNMMENMQQPHCCTRAHSAE